jgi:hypothetical protein
MVHRNGSVQTLKEVCRPILLAVWPMTWATLDANFHRHEGMFTLA